ncbi:MAG TPA: preprotein translocase subunit SecG [Thermomonas sp.]|nr:preprotein translocase subunit SecG [Thermomonas sp.]
MLLQVINVLYVLVAIAMIGLILMQRGAGAQAGSGFGGGASSTVFGSRGASNFLTKTTRWLAVLFFAISLGMAVYASKTARQGQAQAKPDLGVMAQQPAVPAAAPQVPSAPAQPAPAPAQPAPQAPAQGQ